jgi:hypothetical protein
MATPSPAPRACLTGARLGTLTPTPLPEGEGLGSARLFPLYLWERGTEGVRGPRKHLSGALGLALLGALLLGSPSARADEPSRPAQSALPSPIAKPPSTIWYGWEPLIASLGTQALPLALLYKQPLTALALGTLLSPVTTFVMHEMHGDTTKGYVSVAVSYAMIVGGGVVGAKVACGDHLARRCGVNGALIGAILGGSSAIVLDAVTLAWGKPAPEPPKRTGLWTSVAPLPGGVMLGVGGAF